MLPETLRILIIDDEECIRDSLAMHLASLGHEVLVFAEPSRCPAFRQHDCHLAGPCADLIFVDQNMPGMTGVQLLRHMTRHGCRILPRNRILMTGHVTPELEAEIRRMNCQIVQKPLRFDALEAIVDEARMFVRSDRVLSDPE